MDVYLIGFIIGIAFLITIGLLINLFFRERIYQYKNTGWLDIKNHPIPEDIKEYIATDGKKVKHFKYITWGPYGKVYFDEFNKKFITHWLPLPGVPEEKNV